MLQLLLIALGAILALMGLMILAKRELRLSGSSQLRGAQAAIAGLIVLALGLGTVFYAWVILPAK